MRIKVLANLVLVCIGVLHSLIGSAQPVSHISDLPTITPPSPNAAALGKYGDIPVSQYTGVANVSIPLYTIQVGSFSLPISVSYHAQGLKVEEKASWVGLGWTLNAGGVVTRSIAGLADETGLGYWYHSNWTNDTLLADQAKGESFCKGSYDMQPDMFYYNFSGSSGKFVMDGASPHNAHFIPFNNLQLSHDNSLNQFTITDERGIIYLFNAVEQVWDDNVAPITIYKSAWYLTKIITPAGNINFSYSPETTYSTQTTSRDYLNGAASGEAPLYNPGPSPTIRSLEHSSLILSSINFPTGSIVFIKNPSRQDMPTASAISGMTVSDVNNKMLRKFNFSQSYFGNTGSSAAEAVRLKLDNIIEISPADSTMKKVYTFDYYNPAQVPSTLSYSQDDWGFYNGQPNTTLLPYVDPIIYGAAMANQAPVYGNRASFSNYSQTGMLKLIKYPTGGTSQFIYEGNDYGNVAGQNVNDVVKTNLVQTAAANRSGSNNVPSQTTNVTINQNQTVTVNISGHYTSFPLENGPTVDLNRINADGSRTSILHQPLVNASTTQYPSLTTGNYELIASVDEANQTASISVGYYSVGAAIKTKSAGGLRIRQIVTSDSVGGPVNVKLYQYTSASDSTRSSGCLVSAVQTIETQNSRSWGYLYLVRSAISCNYLGFTQGSHIGYATVTEKDSGATGNGAKVSYFTTSADYPNLGGTTSYYQSPSLISPAGLSSKYLVDYDVCRGLLTQEIVYNANNTIVKKTISTYNTTDALNPGTLNHVELPSKVGYYFYMCDDQCAQCNTTCPKCASCTDFSIYNFTIADYKIVCPWIYKTSFIDTTYDINGQNPIGVTINYYYDNPAHGLLTRTISLNSKGDTLKTVNIYPGDKLQITALDPAAGVVLDTMVTRNIIGPIVQEEHYYNANLVSRIRTDYAIWPGSFRNISPFKKWYQIGTNPIENRISFLAYDYNDNPVQLSKSTGINISYIWDYLSSCPIAEVKNADTASIAYTSFEADGSGNWVISAKKIGATGGFTGNNFDTLSTGATISKSGLTASRNYFVTYWSKNGPLTISGTTATSGLVKRGWTFYQHSLPAGSTFVSITGSGIILDELRLYPTDAQMVTYTYTLLVGVSSNCSANNLTTYYEYDGLGRLLRIRDVDGNILKQYDYQYQVPATY